jgi:hypothetical protein
MVRALILAQTTTFLNQPQKQTMLSQKAVILRKPSGEVAESRGLTVFWILRLRFASRRMTKFAMFQYHDLCLCCFTNRRQLLKMQSRLELVEATWQIQIRCVFCP